MPEGWMDGARSCCMSFADSMEPLEPRTLLAGVSFNINFQPAGAAVPAYYKADIGAAYGMRANGLTYGWSADNHEMARDRNSPASRDQKHDTLNQFEPEAGQY